jgi:hypothetical protein
MSFSLYVISNGLQFTNDGITKRCDDVASTKARISFSVIGRN